MSKIAEKKAEKLFPLQSIEGGEIEAYFNAGQLHKREIYIECYDQAMQDFLEKAEEWLEPTFKNLAGYNCGGDLMNDFKNYMQNDLR